VYQIKDVATGEFYRTPKEEAFKWETRSEAWNFAKLNFPGGLDNGVITIVPVQPVSPDYVAKVACIRAILDTMTAADVLTLISDLLESTPIED
jgi:hypothetical protein